MPASASKSSSMARCRSVRGSRIGSTPRRRNPASLLHTPSRRARSRGNMAAIQMKSKTGCAGLSSPAAREAMSRPTSATSWRNWGNSARCPPCSVPLGCYCGASCWFSSRTDSNSTPSGDAIRCGNGCSAIRRLPARSFWPKCSPLSPPIRFSTVCRCFLGLFTDLSMARAPDSSPPSSSASPSRFPPLALARRWRSGSCCVFRRVRAAP